MKKKRKVSSDLVRTKKNLEKPSKKSHRNDNTPLREILAILVNIETC